MAGKIEVNGAKGEILNDTILGNSTVPVSIGGGSAGTINIRAVTITGIGSVSCSGGDGLGSYGLGGAGGRVALSTGSKFTFRGAITASGGRCRGHDVSAAILAGAGTVYVEEDTQSPRRYHRLVVRGNNTETGVTRVQVLAVTDVSGQSPDDFIYDRVTIAGKRSMRNSLIHISETICISVKINQYIVVIKCHL